MKTILSRIAVLTGLAFLANGASAFAGLQTFTAVNDYVHTTPAGTVIPGVHLDSTGRTGVKEFDDVFDLTADGFDPSVDTAFAGVGFFDITDLNNPGTTDTLRLDLGPVANLNHAPVVTGLYPFDFGPINIRILEDINSDGTLDFSVIAQSGTFFLTGARLEVLAQTPSVPDGGSTFALLGLGVMGMGAMGYRARRGAA